MPLRFHRLCLCVWLKVVHYAILHKKTATTRHRNLQSHMSMRKEACNLDDTPLQRRQNFTTHYYQYKLIYFNYYWPRLVSGFIMTGNIVAHVLCFAEGLRSMRKQKQMPFSRRRLANWPECANFCSSWPHFDYVYGILLLNALKISIKSSQIP